MDTFKIDDSLMSKLEMAFKNRHISLSPFRQQLENERQELQSRLNEFSEKFNVNLTIGVGRNPHYQLFVNMPIEYLRSEPLMPQDDNTH